MASKALERAVTAVMEAMPSYGNRMSYTSMKAVVGWPRGYYNITKLARTLEERGLALPRKRGGDKVVHLEAVAQGAVITPLPEVAAPRRYTPPVEPDRAAQEARARLVRLEGEEARNAEQARILNDEIARQHQAEMAEEARRQMAARALERQQQQAAEAKAAFTAPIKGNGAGPCQGPPALVLDDSCGAEVYGAWGARKPAAS